MWESIMKFIRKVTKKEDQSLNSKDAAKERLHLVLMQDRANVSADFLDLMKQEIIEVIKKYIEVDETAIDVRLTNKDNGDGTKGAPALYANIPIVNIKDEVRQNSKVQQNEQKEDEKPQKTEESVEETKEEKVEEKNNEEDTLNQESNTDTENSNQIIHEEDKQSEEVTIQNTEN